MHRGLTIEERCAALGVLIRTIRNVQGLTQDDLALAGNMSERTVHCVEHGKPTAHLRLVVSALECLGLEIDVQPFAATANCCPEVLDAIDAFRRECGLRDRTPRAP